MVLFLLVLRDLGDHKVAPVKDFFQLNRKKSLKSSKSYARGPKRQRKSYYKSQRVIRYLEPESYQILGTNFYHHKFRSMLVDILIKSLGRLQQTSFLHNSDLQIDLGIALFSII